MKKIYGLLCLGMTLVLPGTKLLAQLNGAYTIDNTIPSSATNFTSFTAFANAINANGVSGPVVVNVGATSGPYNEQIEIIQYAGASATNSVVINGNGRTITYNATNTALRHTIMLSGADYMTWNNLHIVGTNATSALVVHLWNDADYNTFNNCLIEAPVNGTSSTQTPFSISGSSVAATTAGRAGSGNVVNSCTITGGYYGVTFCGSSGMPQNIDNELRNSIIRDFYTYGFYNVYCLNTKVIGNVIDRLNRTTVTSTYPIYLSTGSVANIVEGNHIRDLFKGITNNTSAIYAIYLIADATPNDPNIVRNNVISDINNNGTQIGIYLSGSDYVHAEHNTVSLDDFSSSAGATYGIYSTGAFNRVRNNNVSISRGGSGTKYGLYYTTAATSIISDYNNVYIGSTSGINYFGFLGTNYSNLAAWQTATGLDLNSLSLDPQYSNPMIYDYAPTNLAINNMALPIGLLYDVLNAPRSPLAPDPGAYEIYNSPCTSAPPSNSFIVPSGSICPGMEVEFVLQNTNTYTNSGYVVQWQASTISVGGYTAIPGATLNAYSTNQITTNTYFRAVVTCTNTNQSTDSPPGLVMVMPIIQDTVPYFESFETPAQNNLPNCYWLATNHEDYTFTGITPASNNRIARTGTGYAYFQNHPFPNYFFTNEIYLHAGVTYSAALWYLTENVGYNPWDEISILIGTSQSSVALQPIVSETPVAGQLYTLLSNTLTVQNSGYYYLAVRAVGGYDAAPYLTWDDLSITIPCSHNSPAMSVLAPTNEVCENIPVTLMAGGANTYSWSTGAQSSSIVVTPPTHSTYIVHGYHTLSGCASSVAVNLSVTTSPAVGALASHYSVCAGQSTTLSATGANSYYWSTGATTSVTIVNPTVTTLYEVAGTNQAGCTSSAQVYVQVSPAPVLITQVSNSLVCEGEAVELIAAGANSYVWLAPNLYSTSNKVKVIPQTSTMFTVTGTTESGCSVTSQVFVVVNNCTGLEQNALSDFKIFPNPASEQLFVQTDGREMSITITDVSGRVIASQITTGTLTNIDLKNFSVGVYYIRLQAGDYNRIEKFIRQ